MVTLRKDKKSPSWILTTRDSEGYHKQMNLTFDDLLELEIALHGILQERYETMEKVGRYTTTINPKP